MNAKIIFLLATLLLVLAGCGPEERPDPIYLKTELVRVYDISEDPEIDFCAVKKNGYYRCSFPTIQVRKAENVERITAYHAGRELTIIAQTDKSLWPAPLDRMIMVDFNLYGLPSGEYDVTVCVDAAVVNHNQRTWIFD